MTTYGYARVSTDRQTKHERVSHQAMSNPFGIMPSILRISAASTVPVCKLLRLENATAPTVLLLRIINSARLTARRASGHSMASPGENLSFAL
jgi:hypothetical protein